MFTKKKPGYTIKTGETLLLLAFSDINQWKCLHQQAILINRPQELCLYEDTGTLSK